MRPCSAADPMTASTPLATAVAPHVFWLVSRAAGIAALVLSSAAVCLGLLMGARLASRRGPEMRVLHEALSLATLGAIAVHGLALVGDSYLHPTLGEVGIPFLGSYRTVWTSTGIVAFWMLALLGLSYYLRGRIGVRRWRSLHRLTALAWLLGVVHSLGAGTDAGQAWFLTMTAIVAIPPLVLLLVRHLRPSSSRSEKPVVPPRRLEPSFGAHERLAADSQRPSRLVTPASEQGRAA
jgi:sulfoxide reductase heme-binding subunit YedZ